MTKTLDEKLNTDFRWSSVQKIFHLLIAKVQLNGRKLLVYFYILLLCSSHGKLGACWVSCFEGVYPRESISNRSIPGDKESPPLFFSSLLLFIFNIRKSRSVLLVRKDRERLWKWPTLEVEGFSFYFSPSPSTAMHTEVLFKSIATLLYYVRRQVSEICDSN